MTAIAETQAANGRTARGKRVENELPVLIEGGISKLDIEQLGSPLRNKVLTLEKKLRAELKRVGDSELAAGKVLLDIQELLQPLKLFVLYLNRQPWLSVATAYRYINAYKRAKSDPKLSPAVVEIAVAEGVPLFGATENRPYGKLTDAVEAMPKAPNDQEGAARWLAALRVKQKEIQKPRVVLSPLDRLAQGIVAIYNRQLGKEDMMEWPAFWAELKRRSDILVKRLEHEREAA